VRCHYFVYAQRPEDRILKALVRKTETIKRELGNLAQVVEVKLTDALGRGGISRDSIDALEREIGSANADADAAETVNEELEASRDRREELGEQIDLLRTRLGESSDWVNLKEIDFRAAISSALGLVGGAALAPEGTPTASRHSTAKPAATRAGPRRSISSAHPASAASSSGIGAGNPRSAPWFSTTLARWPTTWSTSTSNTPSSSGCSGASSHRGSSTKICLAPASRNRVMQFIALFS